MGSNPEPDKAIGHGCGQHAVMLAHSGRLGVGADWFEVQPGVTRIL